MGGTKAVLVLVAGDVVKVDRVEVEVCCVAVVGLTSDFDLSFSVICRPF